MAEHRLQLLDRRGVALRRLLVGRGDQPFSPGDGRVHALHRSGCRAEVAISRDLITPAPQPVDPLRIERVGTRHVEALLQGCEVLVDAGGEGRQPAEGDRVVGPGAHQQLQQLVHQSGIGAAQAELAGPHRVQLLLHRCGKSIADLIQPLQGLAVALEQRPQGRPEHLEVGFGSLRLVEEAEMLATAGPGLKAGIEQLTEAEGSVVERVAAGGAVVAVEVALAVANPDPVRHQAREPCAEQPRQLQHLLAERQRRINLRPVVARDQVLNDQLQLVQRLRVGLAAGAAGEQLQLPHPQERWRHPGGDRRRVVDHDVGVERA